MRERVNSAARDIFQGLRVNKVCVMSVQLNKAGARTVVLLVYVCAFSLYVNRGLSVDLFSRYRLSALLPSPSICL